LNVYRQTVRILTRGANVFCIEHRLRVFQNRVPRRIFGFKREEIATG